MPTTELHHIKQDFNIYGQSPSLLLQFILSEFICTFYEIQFLEKTYKEMEIYLIKKRLQGDSREDLKNILDSTIRLIGATIMDETALPWDSQKGSLNKLRQYCYSFVPFHSKTKSEKSVVNFSTCVSNAFHSALQARELLQYFLREMNLEEKKVPEYAMLYQLFDKLIDNINRGSRLLLHIIMEYRNDENVVYFLLRHNEAFNTMYGSRFVIKIFKKMYPNGIEDVGQFLMKKYSERGFSNLLNTIATKISEISELS